MTDCQQKVVIDCYSQSEFQRLTSNVPQGSILGPFCFLIYTNNLPKVIKTVQIVLYDVDKSVVVSLKTKETTSSFLILTVASSALISFPIMALNSTLIGLN